MTETGITPHPGGRLDAVAQAAAHEAPPAAPEQPGAEDYRHVVPVHQEMPEECVPRTLALSAANPYLPVLPRDMRRRRAVLLAIDNDVVLCETKELAQQVAAAVAGGAAASTITTGGYLPKGMAVALESRDLMYAAATTTASGSRVLVIAERYAEA